MEKTKNEKKVYQNKYKIKGKEIEILTISFQNALIIFLTDCNNFGTLIEKNYDNDFNTIFGYSEKNENYEILSSIFLEKIEKMNFNKNKIFFQKKLFFNFCFRKFSGEELKKEFLGLCDIVIKDIYGFYVENME